MDCPKVLSRSMITNSILILILILICQFGDAMPSPHRHNDDHGHHGHHRRRYQMEPVMCNQNPNNNKNIHFSEPEQDRNLPSPPIDFGQPVPQNHSGSLDRFVGVPQPAIPTSTPTMFPFPTSTKPKPTEGSGLQIIPSGKQQEELPTTEGDSNGTCSTGSGIFVQTGLCYKFATQTLGSDDPSPCGPFMNFYQSNSDPKVGVCDCKSTHLGISRPIVYWEKTDQCYWIYDQGPCQLGEWLVLNDSDVPICIKRSCPENVADTMAQPGGNGKFWFRYRGKCYQTGENTESFCENPMHKIFLVMKGPEGRYEIECKGIVVETKTLLNGVKPLPCMPGHKQSATGECKKPGTFE